MLNFYDALDYQNQRIANTYVFTDKKENVVAFFSLSNDCLNDLGNEKGFRNAVWNKFYRLVKLPNSKRIKQYPSIKIGRSGVHNNFHGTGLAYGLMDPDQDSKTRIMYYNLLKIH